MPDRSPVIFPKMPQRSLALNQGRGDRNDPDREEDPSRRLPPLLRTLETARWYEAPRHEARAVDRRGRRAPHRRARSLHAHLHGRRHGQRARLLRAPHACADGARREHPAWTSTRRWRSTPMETCSPPRPASNHAGIQVVGPTDHALQVDLLRPQRPSPRGSPATRTCPACWRAARQGRRDMLEGVGADEGSSSTPRGCTTAAKGDVQVKLAALKQGGRDGALVVVSRDPHPAPAVPAMPATQAAGCATTSRPAEPQLRVRVSESAQQRRGRRPALRPSGRLRPSAAAPTSGRRLGPHQPRRAGASAQRRMPPSFHTDPLITRGLRIALHRSARTQWWPTRPGASASEAEVTVVTTTCRWAPPRRRGGEGDPGDAGGRRQPAQPHPSRLARGLPATGPDKPASAFGPGQHAQFPSARRVAAAVPHHAFGKPVPAFIRLRPQPAYAVTRVSVRAHHGLVSKCCGDSQGRHRSRRRPRSAEVRTHGTTSRHAGHALPHLRRRPHRDVVARAVTSSARSRTAAARGG